jgi:hypothetical protein
MTEDSKPETPKTPDSKSQSWWQTLPGLITAIAGTITAIEGLLAGLNQVGLLPSTTTKSANSLASAPSSPDDEIMVYEFNPDRPQPYKIFKRSKFLYACMTTLPYVISSRQNQRSPHSPNPGEPPKASVKIS